MAISTPTTLTVYLEITGTIARGPHRGERVAIPSGQYPLVGFADNGWVVVHEAIGEVVEVPFA